MPPTNASRKVAATVRAALSEAGVSNPVAASWLNISLATMERRLAGTGKPFDTVQLEWIAERLGVDFFDLMRRAESQDAA